MRKVKEFEIVDLGIEYPDYFRGFGVCGTPYEYCAYGIGDTPAEALEDCLEMVAQSDDIDMEDLERRIQEEFGTAPDTPSAMDECGIDPDDCYELPYYHIGIRFNLED